MISYRFRPCIVHGGAYARVLRGKQHRRRVNEIPITNGVTRGELFFLSLHLPHPHHLALSLPHPPTARSTRATQPTSQPSTRAGGNNLSGQGTIRRNPKIETKHAPLRARFVFSLQVQRLARGTSDHGMHENHALDPLDRGPYFDVTASRNVTALVGKTATLNCRVRNLGDRTVGNERHSLRAAEDQGREE